MRLIQLKLAYYIKKLLDLVPNDGSMLFTRSILFGWYAYLKLKVWGPSELHLNCKQATYFLNRTNIMTEKYLAKPLTVNYEVHVYDHLVHAYSYKIYKPTHIVYTKLDV